MKVKDDLGVLPFLNLKVYQLIPKCVRYFCLNHCLITKGITIYLKYT